MVDAWDFNEVRFTHENLGGNFASLRRCQTFNQWIERCEMRVLSFHGPKFTWDNNREGRANFRNVLKDH